MGKKLVLYRNLVKILSPAPLGLGGKALNDNFKALADAILDLDVNVDLTSLGDFSAGDIDATGLTVYNPNASTSLIVRAGSNQSSNPVAAFVRNSDGDISASNAVRIETYGTQMTIRSPFFTTNDNSIQIMSGVIRLGTSSIRFSPNAIVTAGGEDVQIRRTGTSTLTLDDNASGAASLIITGTLQVAGITVTGNQAITANVVNGNYISWETAGQTYGGFNPDQNAIVLRYDKAIKWYTNGGNHWYSGVAAIRLTPTPETNTLTLDNGSGGAANFILPNTGGIGWKKTSGVDTRIFTLDAADNFVFGGNSFGASIAIRPGSSSHSVLLQDNTGTFNNAIFNSDGTGSMARGHITWDASGNLTAVSLAGDGSAITGITPPTLNDLLAASNDAGGQNITNLNAIIGLGGISTNSIQISGSGGAAGIFEFSPYNNSVNLNGGSLSLGSINASGNGNFNEIIVQQIIVLGSTINEDEFSNLKLISGSGTVINDGAFRAGSYTGNGNTPIIGCKLLLVSANATTYQLGVNDDGSLFTSTF